MGGGGGSVGYGRGSQQAMRTAMQQSVAAEEGLRFDADVNRGLQELLTQFNGIDREQIRSRLDDIDEALGEHVAFDRFLYAGSVAKHTAIDGLSDVDALLVFSPDQVAGDSPQAIRQEIAQRLQEGLSAAAVKDIRVGQMAVTVVYRDGLEVQLLPAIGRGDAVQVPAPDGRNWITTRPHEFRQRLSAANEALGSRLVPCIKLFKSLVENLPPQQRMSGYHIEAIAVETAASYPADRPRSLKAVLTHLVESAAQRVLSPIGDVTGQSTAIDSELGAASSAPRRLISDSLSKVARRLATSRDFKEWMQTIG